MASTGFAEDEEVPDRGAGGMGGACLTVLPDRGRRERERLDFLKSSERIVANTTAPMTRGMIGLNRSAGVPGFAEAIVAVAPPVGTGVGFDR